MQLNRRFLSLIVLFFVSCAVSPAQSGVTVSDSRYWANNGHTYYLLSGGKGSGLTWDEAENFAVNTLGGHLATVDSPELDSWLWETFGRSANINLWIGLTDRVTEGLFRWVATGQVPGFTNWSAGEPNNYRNEDYVFILKSFFVGGYGPGEGEWNDAQRTWTEFFGAPIFAIAETSGPAVISELEKLLDFTDKNITINFFPPTGDIRVETPDSNRSVPNQPPTTQAAEPIVADPVNSLSGNYFFTQTDFSFKAIQPLSLTRNYNSLDKYPSPLGRGWSSLFFACLKFYDPLAIFLTPNGSRIIFANQNGVYVASPGYDLTLASSTNGTWVVSSPKGKAWVFNSDGKIQKIVPNTNLPTSGAVDFTYSTDGNLQRVSNPAGQWFDFAYDTASRVIEVVDSAGRTAAYSYSPEGFLASYTDPLGKTTTYSYDSDGFLTQITAPGNRTISIVYENERAVKVIDSLGNETNHAWDLVNHRLTTTDSNGTNYLYGFSPKDTASTTNGSFPFNANYYSFSSYAVPSLGISKQYLSSGSFLAAETDSFEYQRKFTHDQIGLLTSETDKLGKTATYEYHSVFHQLAKKTDDLGRVWEYTWNTNGTLASEKDPLGGITAYFFDSHGNKTSATDPLGRTTQFVYDQTGSFLVQIINAQGGIASFTYDNRGNLILFADTLGRVTQNQYDLLDRVTKTIFPDGQWIQVTYDDAGRLISKLDNLGRITQYQWDLNGNLNKLIRPDSTEFAFTYSGTGKKLTQTDPLGRLTRFEYNGIGLLTKVIYPDGAVESFSYDTEGRLIGKTDELGNVSTLSYDPMGRLIAAIDPTGARWESQYDSVGRKISDKDPLNRVTFYQFDNLDRITKVIRPDNTFITNSFDSVGNLLSTVDALENTWSWIYDNLNRPVTAIQPNGASSTTGFDAAGQVVSETDELNRVTRYAFDLGGRITATTDALDNVWRNFYDSAGRLTAVKDPLGAVSSLTYDVMNRVISQSDPLGNVNSFEFDNAGRRVAKTDSMGRRSITVFDPRDRVTGEVDPEGHTVSYGYNAAGWRVSLTDGANRTWRWEFDSLGRVTAEFDPLGNVNRPGFDAVGNRISMTNARNQTTTFAVDSMNRLTQVNYPDGTLATMAFDLEGREISRFGPSGSVVKTWDSVGNLTSETFGPWGKKWQFSFDLVGNRISAIDPEGQVFKYSVDKLNRVVSLNPPEKGDEVKFSFDSAGRLIAEERPGVKTTNRFDMAGRLLELKHERDHGKEKIVASRICRYNSVGNRVSEQNEAGETSNYGFNGSGWLTRAQYPDGQQVLYGYNGAGDRLSEITETPTVKKVGRNTVIGTDTVVIPFGYDSAGRLISRASDTFVFDADGNLVSAVENGDETRYFWTPDNRLVRVEKDIECQKHGKKKCGKCPQVQNFTKAEEYGYLPNDWRRITRKADGLQFVSIFENSDESHEYLLKFGRDDDDKDEKGKRFLDKEDKNPRLKLIRQFIGGPGTDDLVATRYHGRNLWHLTDSLGSTIALTNRGGKTLAKIGYDAWGNFRYPDKPGFGLPPLKESDLADYLDRCDGGRAFENSGFDPWHMGRHHSRALTSVMYTGARLDAFTGNYNLRNRYLNTRHGRFLSVDPIGFLAGPNRFGYCRNNPLIYTDPFGLYTEQLDYGQGPEPLDYVGPLSQAAWAIAKATPGALAHAVFISPFEDVGNAYAGFAEGTWAGVGKGTGYTLLAAAGFIGMGELAVGIKQGVKALGQGGTKLLNSWEIRFSQDSVKAGFKNPAYGTIDDLAAGLRSGKIKPSDIEPIRIVEREGKLISIDNRRLKAFQDAGINVPTRMATPEEIAEAIKQGKFSAGPLGGETIRVRSR